MIGTEKSGEAASEITAESYAYLQQHIYRESGIVLDPGKQYLLKARLGPIVRRQGLSSINDLCNLMRAAGRENLRQEVVEAMTTNETQFFRDPAQYEALKTAVLPELIERRMSARRLSFWSAAASSGQEAYSLAMLLRELGLGDWDVRILGTDLAESVLERARAARYTQLEINRGLPAAYLVKYFTRHGLEWHLRDEIRRMVRFERHDLRKSVNHFGPFDVVFCRNVLIYFDVETKRKILRQIHGAMWGGGYLLLGAVETALELEELYERKSIGQATLYRAR